MKVTIAHLRSVPGFTARRGFCASGARAWFQRHGLDWSEFVRHGIDAEQLVATGDGMALKLVEHARQEDEHGQ
jgi:hypothetical protein